VASAVGSGQATAITRFAVRHGNETAVVQFVPGSGTVAAFLNGRGVAGGYATGAWLRVSVAAGNVTVVDALGNAVVAVASGGMFTLQTSPRPSCGTPEGLCGDADGDRANDLRPRGEGAALPPGTAGRAVYAAFVVSWLVTDVSESLFPPDAFADVRGDAGYVPLTREDTLGGDCPALCGGDGACCFDAAVGGPSFAALFVRARATVNATSATALRPGENAPPEFTAGPLRLSVGHTAPLVYTAADADTVAALRCDVCAVVGAVARCEATGIGTATATLTVYPDTATGLGARTITCVARDVRGAEATTRSVVAVPAVPPSWPPLPTTAQPQPQKDGRVPVAGPPASYVVDGCELACVVGGAVGVFVVAIALAALARLCCCRRPRASDGIEHSVGEDKTAGPVPPPPSGQALRSPNERAAIYLPTTAATMDTTDTAGCASGLYPPCGEDAVGPSHVSVEVPDGSEAGSLWASPRRSSSAGTLSRGNSAGSFRAAPPVSPPH
jgi:hypothetical protein